MCFASCLGGDRLRLPKCEPQKGQQPAIAGCNRSRLASGRPRLARHRLPTQLITTPPAPAPLARRPRWLWVTSTMTARWSWWWVMRAATSPRLTSTARKCGSATWAHKLTRCAARGGRPGRLADGVHQDCTLLRHRTGAQLQHANGVQHSAQGRVGRSMRGGRYAVPAGGGSGLAGRCTAEAWAGRSCSWVAVQVVSIPC